MLTTFGHVNLDSSVAAYIPVHVVSDEGDIEEE